MEVIRTVKKKEKKKKSKKQAKRTRSRKPKISIVKKGGKADIIDVNTRTETIKVRTKIVTKKKGKEKISHGSRSYKLSTKTGLSPKRV